MWSVNYVSTKLLPKKYLTQALTEMGPLQGARGLSHQAGQSFSCFLSSEHFQFQKCRMPFKGRGCDVRSLWVCLSSTTWVMLALRFVHPHPSPLILVLCSRDHGKEKPGHVFSWTSFFWGLSINSVVCEEIQIYL